MVSSVTAKPNHYEVLGLASTASADEIAKAYAAQMTTFRLRPENALKRLASLSTAYETLRDPAKRSAYDQSLGVHAEPTVGQDPPPFIAAAVARPEPLPDSRPEPRPKPPPEPRPEPRPDVGSFIAASLRPPVQKTQPESVAVARAEPVSFAVEESARRTIDRNQATIAAGLVGLAVLALAISVFGRNPERLPAPAAPSPQAVTVGLPPATPAPTGVAAQPPAPTVEAAVPPEQAPVEAAEQPATAPPDAPAAPDQQPATRTASTETSPPAATETPAAIADQAPADANTATTPAVDTAQTPATATAKLPLANATIARTIERIGYHCGSVASTGAMDASGVFQVTCSSGDTYQATPVHGRYHFRKVGGQ